MKVTTRTYANALAGLCKGKTHKEIDERVKNFIAFLKKQGESKKFFQIFRDLSLILAKEEGVHAVRVRMASKDSELEHRLVTALTKQVGEASTICVEYDPSLIGGACITVDNTVVDGSLRCQLELLKSSL